jgi:phosphoribosylformylglycinamidine cyclo-ligase
LVGGEMAEHPGAMDPGDFDLVGFAVGAVERDEVLGPDRVRPGDALIGLPEHGLRSNGYSLARRIIFDVARKALHDPAWDGAHETVADVLLRPSTVYAPAIGELQRHVDLHAVAHITGGGIPGNLVRALPDGTEAVVAADAWERPPIFAELARVGSVSEDEMRKVFNLGIGMITIVPPDDTYKALDVLRAAGHRAIELGTVAEVDSHSHAHGHAAPTVRFT